MNAGDKFLVLAMLIFSTLVVRRGTSTGAFIMIVGLLAWGWHMIRHRYRP